MQYLKPKLLHEISLEKIMIDVLENATPNLQEEPELSKRLWSMANVLANNQWKLTG